MNVVDVLIRMLVCDTIHDKTKSAFDFTKKEFIIKNAIFVTWPLRQFQFNLFFLCLSKNSLIKHIFFIQPTQQETVFSIECLFLHLRQILVLLIQKSLKKRKDVFLKI